MGNCLAKLCCVRTRHTVEPKKYNAEPPTSEQREKLEELFEHIISKAPVDFSNVEIQAIQNAVCIMLARIKTRVNNRGIFRIAHVVPTGSMTEKTALWKVHNYTYLEFDFLAKLENSVKQCKARFARNGCGCIEIAKPPVELKRLTQYYNREDEFDTETVKDKDVISDLFLSEINYCVTSSCDCLAIKCEIGRAGGYNISFRPASVEHGCEKCTVDMTSGTLSVNTEITIDQTSPNKCSLIFLWTSKAKGLSAPDKLLLMNQKIHALPIHVDFLPALESMKPAAFRAGDEHDYFIVPKGCNVCRYYVRGYQYRWRKSWCVAEINVFNTTMSEKHRRCMQIIKYLFEMSWKASFRNYHLKTVVLRHHTTCKDTTDNSVECVIGIIRDLLHAYESNQLLLHQSNMNILKRERGASIMPALKYCKLSDAYSQILSKLYSVPGTDSWDTFVWDTESESEKYTCYL